MSGVFVLGRLLFVAYFLYGGLQKLISVAATAALFADKITVPAPLAAMSAALENTIGLSTPQFVVLLAGTVEFAAAVLLAFSIGARCMAAVLIVYPVAAIYYFHNFWTMAGEARENALADAMMNVSIIGGLVVFFALGRWRLGEPEAPGGV